MADQHALFEAFPGKLSGAERRRMRIKWPVFVNNRSFPVQDIGQNAPG